MAEKTNKQDDVKKEKTKKTATVKKTTAAKTAKATKKPVTSKVTKKVEATKASKKVAEKPKKEETAKKVAQTKTEKETKTAKTKDASKVSNKEVKKTNKKTSSLQTVNLKEKKPSVRKVDAVVKNNITTFLKQKDVVKKWFVLDAAGKPLGRVAAFAASILRGKHKVDFTPNVDCGDCVIVVNCKDVVLTGRKLEQKVKYRHSGWIGGLKQVRYNDLMKTKPQLAMELAIKGMLPHNKLGAKMAKHLKVYKDENHEHEAQKPELLELSL